MGPFFKRIDAAVMGRKSYEMGLKLGGGKLSSHGMECYVFSKTLGSVAHEDFAIGADFYFATGERFADGSLGHFEGMIERDERCGLGHASPSLPCSARS